MGGMGAHRWLCTAEQQDSLWGLDHITNICMQLGALERNIHNGREKVCVIFRPGVGVPGGEGLLLSRPPHSIVGYSTTH